MATFQNNTTTTQQNLADDDKKQHIKDIVSLSDDDDEELNDPMTSLTDLQKKQITQNGYCVICDPATNVEIMNLINGFIRCNYFGIGMIPEIIQFILYYYGSRYNINRYVELVSNEKMNPQYFLLPVINASLSKLLTNSIDAGITTIRLTEANKDTLHHILKYLGYHRDIEPDPVACPVPSINMSDFVSKWDADYIDPHSKATIFNIIIAANYMDIKCLLHLACAKIATLIKALPQQEINRIIEEEEKYMREHVDDNDDDGNNNDDNDADDIDNDDDEKGVPAAAVDTNIDKDIVIKQILLEGWLYKKSRFFKSWRKRWVVLDININSKNITLFTFKNAQIYKNPTETILITNDIVIQDKSGSKFNNEFSITNRQTKQTFVFKASTENNKKLWISTIATSTQNTPKNSIEQKQ